MTTKSPLRYPGGKSRAVDTLYGIIEQHLTDNKIDTICSPFFGGGSFEIFLCEKEYEVYGYDIFTPLAEFWKCILYDPGRLADTIQKYHKSYELGIPSAKEQFYSLQKNQMTIDNMWDRAAVFFVLNRSSFSGSTMSGGWSPNYPRFNASSIDRVRRFVVSNLIVSEMSFEQSILLHPDAFLYLDPPYMIDNDNLYGKKGSTHKGFDHNLLYGILSARDNWIMSYNDGEEIRELYKNYTIRSVSWAYGMTADRKSKEIVILSNDLDSITHEELIGNIFNGQNTTGT